MPYRAEYLPLLRPLQRGMPRFRASFALARYFPSEYASAEIAYLARMIERSQGTQPVFGFSRSLARVATLKAGLGGYHIVLRRNPVQQWLSCRSYRSKGLPSYFELCHALILMLAPTHSPARNLARVMGLPRLPWWARRVPRQLQALRAALHPFSDELSYRVFIGVHLLSHAAALPAADLVLDVDRLGTSQSYRARTQTAIATSTGLAVDFDDCHVPVRDTAGIPVDFAASEAHVRRCLLDCGADLEAAQSYEHSRTPVASTVLR